MLKKAGIIVAVAATGVLAVTSLAFADTSKGNLKNDCAFGNASGGATSMIDGGSSLLGGLAGLLTGAATNAATQTNAANCTNVNLSDLIDQDSNNKSKSSSKTKVEHSYNTHN